VTSEPATARDLRVAERRRRAVSLMAFAVLLVLCVLVLLPFRKDENVAAIALVMLLPPLAATGAGPVAAGLAAIVSGLAFNFFFTHPYHSPHIDSLAGQFQRPLHRLRPRTPAIGLGAGAAAGLAAAGAGVAAAGADAAASCPFDFGAAAPSFRKRDGASSGIVCSGWSVRARASRTSCVSGRFGSGTQQSTGQTAAQASWSKKPTHSVHFSGTM